MNVYTEKIQVTSRIFQSIPLASTFSSPEAEILLVCTRNRDLWPLLISEHAQSTCSVFFSQSDLSYVTMIPGIVDFRFWRQPEVSIPGADQKDRGLWGRECRKHCITSIYLISSCHCTFSLTPCKFFDHFKQLTINYIILYMYR